MFYRFSGTDLAWNFIFWCVANYNALCSRVHDFCLINHRFFRFGKNHDLRKWKVWFFIEIWFSFQLILCIYWSRLRQLLGSSRHKCAVGERTDVGGFRFLHFLLPPFHFLTAVLRPVSSPFLSFPFSFSSFPFPSPFFLRWKVVSKSVQLPGLGDTVNSPDPGRNGNSNFLWCTELRDN